MIHALPGVQHFIFSEQRSVPQVEGVKFMWGRIAGPKGEHGCILAHSMGLGKTLSVVTLIHSFARMQVQREKKCQAIIVCPVRSPHSTSALVPEIQHGREQSNG
jgi:SNF2 family DNA or RNA helicase